VYIVNNTTVPNHAAYKVPSAVYLELATWHLINTVDTPQRISELANMQAFCAEPRLHDRLMAVVHQRLGHALIARAEQPRSRWPTVIQHAWRSTPSSRVRPISACRSSR
jgi:hypothetical protein